MIKRTGFLLLLVVVTAWCAAVFAQDLPPRPTPPRLVNDLAAVFNADQQRALERRLVAYDDSTSTQIVIITMKDIGNWEKAQFTYSVGDAWGVGRRHKDNGVVILMNMAKRDLFIATGRGAEGALPDAILKRITDDVMIPFFQRGDYYGGMTAGLDAIQQALAGEFKGVPREAERDGPGVLFWIALLLLILWIVSRNNRRGRGRGVIGRRGYRGFGPVFFPPIGGGFGGRGFGGGGFGGGGFGGFGGGSFGGGGAGGRW